MSSGGRGTVACRLVEEIRSAVVELLSSECGGGAIVALPRQGAVCGNGIEFPGADIR